MHTEVCESSLLSVSDADALFSLVLSLKPPHERFLADLRARTQNGTAFDVSIADLVHSLVSHQEHPCVIRFAEECL